MKISLASCAIALAIVRTAYADPIRTTVVDGQTLQPIAGATVRAGDRVVVADARGAIRVEPGELTVSAPGYGTATQTLVPGDLVILFRDHVLDEVIQVHAHAPHLDASQVLGKDELENLPGGSTDALAAVRSLPGVAATPPTTAGRLVIRGGAPQDSRLTVDGVPVPFVYHAFDNTTIVPVSMIGSIAYSPGGFGVDEGRATSGSVAITSNDGAPAKAGGEVSLSLLDAAAAGATPLARGLYLSGGVRRSTVDLLIPWAVPDSIMVGFTTPPRYYDGQLRLDWIAGAHDRFTLLALTSFDRLGVVNHMTDSDLPADFAQDSQFGRLIASWKHDDGPVANRLVAALGDGEFHAKFDTIQHVDDRNTLALVRDDLAVAATKRLRIRAGAFAELERHDLDSYSIIIPADGIPPGHFDDLPIQTIDTSYDSNYAASYLAAELRPTDTTTITAGTRVDYFGHIHAAVVEPRLEVAQRVAEMTLHAAVGRYARDHDLTEAIPATLVPERATQVSGGTDIDLADGLVATATVYYTARKALTVADPADPLAYASTGLGHSGGVDLLLRYRRDHLFGWVGYSFAKTLREDAPGATWHPTPYDQTHVLTAVGSYQTGPWRFGARFQFATGLPYTDVVGASYDAGLGRYVPVLGTPYGARYPDSAQIDLKLERVWQRKHVQLAAFVDVTNVLRDARVIRYTYNTDFTGRQPLTEFVPLPSIGIRGAI